MISIHICGYNTHRAAIKLRLYNEDHDWWHKWWGEVIKYQLTIERRIDISCRSMEQDSLVIKIKKIYIICSVTKKANDQRTNVKIIYVHRKIKSKWVTTRCQLTSEIKKKIIEIRRSKLAERQEKRYRKKCETKGVRRREKNVSTKIKYGKSASSTHANYLSLRSATYTEIDGF